jgi:hypothetical protein
LQHYKIKMVQLKYKSLVTKEIIDYYLSKIKDDEKQKKNLISTVSKFDIRISTKPVIKGEEFYYKIWILRRGTKKKAHIKEYYPLHMLKFTSSSSFSYPLTLSEILNMIQMNADVPDDFEEYCEIRLVDPSDEVCRKDYLDDLRRAKRFKRFITQEEIKSFPFIIEEEKNNNKQNAEEEKIITIDFNDESDLKLLGYSFVFLNDKKEYDKLAELQNTLNYQAKIVESYGYDTYTGNYNAKVFPIAKEDKQMDSIAKDFENYFKTCSEYEDYLKELIKRYEIKPSGNILKRVAFTLKNDNNMPKHNSNYITTVIDLKSFS